MPHRYPIVLAMTGASGAVYAVRLLQRLLCAGESVHLLISPSGAAVLAQELKLEIGADRNQVEHLLRFSWDGISPLHSAAASSRNEASGKESRTWNSVTEEQLADWKTRLTVHDYRNFMTPVASGSFRTSGMVICPCSGATLSGVVHAAGNNLIQRAADVHLKEHRKLVLVPRETPMSSFQLENMHRASQAGAVVLPAMPGWYHEVRTMVDLVDFIVKRILDHLDVDDHLMQPWAVEPIDVDDIHRASGDA